MLDIVTFQRPKDLETSKWD